MNKCLLSRPGLIAGPLHSTPLQIISQSIPRLDPIDSKSSLSSKLTQCQNWLFECDVWSLLKHFLWLLKAIAPLKIIVRMQVRGDLESSAPALSESPLTFIPKTILRGAMVLQSKWNFFCGHPVVRAFIWWENGKIANNRRPSAPLI